MAVNILGLRPDIRAKYEAFNKQFGLETNSAYRSPSYNAGVNGARNSQHTHGNALDFQVGHLPPEKQQEILQHWRDQGAKGFGYYNNGSAHVDFRDTPAAWGPNRSRTSLPQTPQWFQDFVRNPGASSTTPSMAPTAPTPPLRGSFGADNPIAGPRPATPPARPEGGLLSFGLNGPQNTMPGGPEVAPGVQARNPGAPNGMQMAPNMQGFTAPQNPVLDTPAPAPAADPGFNWGGALSAGLGAFGKWATEASKPQPTMAAPTIQPQAPNKPQVDAQALLAMLGRKAPNQPVIGGGGLLGG